MTLISVVSPVYNAQNIVEPLVDRIIKSVSEITLDFEIVLVNDSCPYGSWEKIEQICFKEKKVKGINLSRNFGQHYAITAGIDHAKGDWIIVMDCDLQDRPEEIPNLYVKALEGFDIVWASRMDRQDSFIKKLSSKVFYKILSYLTGIRQDAQVANFGIFHRKVIDAVNKMREPIRFFPAMVRWVGFRNEVIQVQHDSRGDGKSSYNWRRLINLATDIILAYSDKSLRMMAKVGLAISLISLAVALYFFVLWLTGSIEVLGFTSLIISVWLLSGMILFTLGIVGLYVGKTFEGVKNRPIYLIDSILND